MRETEQDEKNRLLQIAQICRHDKDKLDAIADILDEEGLGTLGYYVTGAAYNLYEAVCDACGIEIEDEEEESSPATVREPSPFWGSGIPHEASEKWGLTDNYDMYIDRAKSLYYITKNGVNTCGGTIPNPFPSTFIQRKIREYKEVERDYYDTVSETGYTHKPARPCPLEEGNPGLPELLQGDNLQKLQKRFKDCPHGFPPHETATIHELLAALEWMTSNKEFHRLHADGLDKLLNKEKKAHAFVESEANNIIVSLEEKMEILKAGKGWIKQNNSYLGDQVEGLEVELQDANAELDRRAEIMTTLEEKLAATKEKLEEARKKYQVVCGFAQKERDEMRAKFVKLRSDYEAATAANDYSWQEKLNDVTFEISQLEKVIESKEEYIATLQERVGHRAETISALEKELKGWRQS